MKRYWLAAAVGGLLLLETGIALGQYPYPGRPAAPYRAPAWSPYLNLFRRGNSPAFNYFGLVKPELDFRRQFQQVEQQFGNVQQNIQGLSQQQQQRPNGLPPTGHPVGFMTHTRYFMNIGGGPSTTGGGLRAPSNTPLSQPASTNRANSGNISSASRFAAPKTNTRGR